MGLDQHKSVSLILVATRLAEVSADLGDIEARIGRSNARTQQQSNYKCCAKNDDSHKRPGHDHLHLRKEPGCLLFVSMSAIALFHSMARGGPAVSFDG